MDVSTSFDLCTYLSTYLGTYVEYFRSPLYQLPIFDPSKSRWATISCNWTNAQQLAMAGFRAAKDRKWWCEHGCDDRGPARQCLSLSSLAWYPFEPSTADRQVAEIRPECTYQRPDRPLVDKVRQKHEILVSRHFRANSSQAANWSCVAEPTDTGQVSMPPKFACWEFDETVWSSVASGRVLKSIGRFFLILQHILLCLWLDALLCTWRDSVLLNWPLRTQCQKELPRFNTNLWLWIALLVIWMH